MSLFSTGDAPALSRRDVLLGAGLGLITIPAFGQGESADYAELTTQEAATLEAFGDALLPGARDAGLRRYIERQLASNTPLLFWRYMDYPGTALSFYQAGLKALDAESVRRFGAVFPELSGEQQSTLIGSLAQQTPPEWDGPPSALFYFVLRNDALDVVYGTLAGFQKLGIPYLAMTMPPRRW